MLLIEFKEEYRRSFQKIKSKPAEEILFWP